MTAESTLDQLDRLLDDERAAIRALDSAETLRLAEAKAELMGRLGPLVAGRADLQARLRASTQKLRDNCLLLAHARDCLREVLGSLAREINAAGNAPSPRASDTPPRRGLYVSVKG